MNIFKQQHTFNKLKNVVSFTFRYLNYFIKSKHYGGHGIHSPFIYNFSQKVIFSKKKHPFFKDIDQIRKSYKHNNKLIPISDYGAGSRISKNNYRQIKNIAKTASTQKKYGELISRMITYLELKNILELGTSLGIGTLYLSSPLKTRVCTIEGDPEIYKQAKTTFKQLKADNITAINKLFDKALPLCLNEMPSLDLVYFDGNHQKQATLDYFEQCLTKISNHSVFIFDDIHWSAEMEAAWEQIKKHKKTRVTIDLFQIGIVFFRKELSKQHFTIKYF